MFAAKTTSLIGMFVNNRTNCAFWQKFLAYMIKLSVYMVVSPYHPHICRNEMLAVPHKGVDVKLGWLFLHHQF